MKQLPSICCCALLEHKPLSPPNVCMVQTFVVRVNMLSSKSIQGHLIKMLSKVKLFNMDYIICPLNLIVFLSTHFLEKKTRPFFISLC